MAGFNLKNVGFSNKYQTAEAVLPIGGWVELGRYSGSATTLNVASLANKRYLMTLAYAPSLSTAATSRIQYNGTGGTAYATRKSEDGGGDNSTSYINFDGLEAKDGGDTETGWFDVGYHANYATKEKLSIMHNVTRSTALASVAPVRQERYGKWADTTNAINRITYYFPAGGGITYGAGSEVVVLGYDPADTHTTNFWTELASVDLSGGAASTISTGTFTNKKYLWVQVFLDMTTTQIPSLRINNVSTGNAYSSRYNNNGGTDGTDVSQNQIALCNFQTGDTFANYFFVNDGTNQPLGFSHAVERGTAGAGYAPDREERVMKTSNTAAITRLDWGNFAAGSGNYGTNTKVKVWGSN